ncbi:hypothetical protein ACHQM5_004856 [Ranunculus cassubicifolius]
MATIIFKSAGKNGGCDPAQLAKRGWRNIDADDDVREPPTCITMLPQKNKDDDEIWVPEKYCKKEKEIPPTDEELNRLARLFTEEIDKITDQEKSLLVRSLPSSHFQVLLNKRPGIKSEKRKASSGDVVSIPFAYEGGDSRHCCGICGKKGHAVFDCSYWNFIPPGVNIGPEYFVKCWTCLQKVSQPVGVCDYCGLEGGVACMKVCIFCSKHGDHMPEECPCPRLKKQKTASETDDSDHPLEKVHPWLWKTDVSECGIQSGEP